MPTMRTTPFGIRYRELWCPTKNINGITNLSAQKPGGQNLLLSTGWRRATTADGVHFDGSANSYINCGAIHNSAVKFWFSLRFKHDATFTAGAPGDVYLCSKYVDANNHFFCFLFSGNGKIYLETKLGVGTTIQVSTVATSWSAGTWHTVTGYTSDVNGTRLIVDSVVSTAVGNNNLPAAGNLVIGNREIISAVSIVGIISDVFVGTFDLTANQELDLYHGLPPISASVNETYTLDAGYGITAVNRVNPGTADGAIGSACTWAWGSVKRALLSPNIQNTASVTAALDISGALTIIWAGKIKDTVTGLARDAFLYSIYIDATNYIWCRDSAAYQYMDMRYVVAGVPTDPHYNLTAVIDEYRIISQVIVPGTSHKIYHNGRLASTQPYTPGVMTGASATIRMNDNIGGGNGGPNKCMFMGIIPFALNDKQMLYYARWLKDQLEIPVSI